MSYLRPNGLTRQRQLEARVWLVTPPPERREVDGERQILVAGGEWRPIASYHADQLAQIARINTPRLAAWSRRQQTLAARGCPPPDVCAAEAPGPSANRPANSSVRLTADDDEIACTREGR